jgi:hypothetical protein
MPSYQDMIQLLLTIAGELMEDASSVALLKDADVSLETRIDRVSSTGRSLAALGEVARLLTARDFSSRSG